MKRRTFVKVLLLSLITALAAFAVLGCDGESEPANAGGDAGGNGASTDPIVVVWYPNESSTDYEGARNEFGRFVTEATGRPVEHSLTTDYVIALEALASGAADIGAMMGPVGFIEVQERTPDVGILFVPSGPSGTLEDAVYFSWFVVPEADADNFKVDGEFSIENIEDTRMSFVSNSSTSGWVIPASAIITEFGQTSEWADIDEDDLIGPGADFFSEVLFGQSHQGTAFNVIDGRADVGTVADVIMDTYFELVEGERNAVGAVYQVRENAGAPFDTVVGERMVLIESIPVFNGPFSYNPANLTADEIQAIIDIFTSEEAANNEYFFTTEDGASAFYTKTEDERFLTVDDAWYDPIRRMMGL